MKRLQKFLLVFQILANVFVILCALAALVVCLIPGSPQPSNKIVLVFVLTAFLVLLGELLRTRKD